MSLDLNRSSRRLAVTLGVVGVGNCISLIALFVIGGPLGTINDVGNAVLGLLSGALAVILWRSGATPGPGHGLVASIVAALGAVVTVIGSVLILTDSTGYFLAGLVSSSGFALIGVWLISLNRPSRRLGSGVVAGAVMALGFIGVPGIAMGVDDMETAPVWLLVGGVSWFGTYILFPIWSIRLGLGDETPRALSAARRDAGRP